MENNRTSVDVHRQVVSIALWVQTKIKISPRPLLVNILAVILFPVAYDSLEYNCLVWEVDLVSFQQLYSKVWVRRAANKV